MHGASPPSEIADFNAFDKEKKRKVYQSGRCGTGHSRLKTCPKLAPSASNVDDTITLRYIVCRSKPQRKPKSKVKVQKLRTGEQPSASMANGYNSTFKLDTCAQCNVISKSTYEQISRHHFTDRKQSLLCLEDTK